MKSVKRLAVFLFMLLTCNQLMIGEQQAQAAGADIVIDGYYDDWSDKPYSWEYNWNNPWTIENYWDGTQNITKRYRDENGNPYNLEIRHRMSLYSDGEYVYLHIKIADNYRAGFNGEDYQFWFDDKLAAFQITLIGGKGLTNSLDQLSTGRHVVEVRHRETSLSYMVAEGAQAYFTKYDGNRNNELELRIPISTMVQQNSRISPKKTRTIEFFTPNLMYRRIACSGVSTGPILGIALGMAFAGGAFLMSKRRHGRRQV